MLSAIRDNSVQCCVTSPPYWGLRDYKTDGLVYNGDPTHKHVFTLTKRKGMSGGPSDKQQSNAGSWHEPSESGFCECGAWKGSLGLEPTPELYVEHMVAVFREVRRVLRKDGVVFLNLGDSYYGSGKGMYADGLSHGTEGKKQKTNIGSVGVQHEATYDTSDKGLEDSLAHGCLCGNLCDVCRVVYRDTSRNAHLLESMLRASLHDPIRERKESSTVHPPTLDSHCQVIRSASSNQDHAENSIRDDERRRVFLKSKLCGFSQQLLGECLQRANRGECLLCAHSLSDYVPLSGCRKVCIDDTVKLLGACCPCMSGKSSSDLAYSYSTTTLLKPKDLVGIPWRVAFALQADGWWLRSDIIWAKANCMPESVQDRPTRSHEYLFLLTKSAKYFYDADAIKEPYSTDDGSTSLVCGFHETPPNQGDHTGKSKTRDAFYQNGGRNKRSVWNLPTQSYTDAHFATFPPKLIEPCILAGSKVGDIVLDPFAGSGTTIMVANKFGRQGVGIELNRDYIKMAHERLREQPLSLGIA